MSKKFLVGLLFFSFSILSSCGGKNASSISSIESISNNSLSHTSSDISTQTTSEEISDNVTTSHQETSEIITSSNNLSSHDSLSSSTSNPTTYSNFVNFGSDQSDYKDQERVSNTYSIGIYTLVGDCKFSKNTGEFEKDGISFTLAYQLGKSGSSNSKCIQFNASKGNKLIVYAIIASSGVSSANLAVYNGGSKINTVTMTDQFEKYELAITSNGNYSIASEATASINIYGIALLDSSNNNDSSSSSSSSIGNLTSEEKQKIQDATNVIDWQLDNGGWGKNYDTTSTFTGYPDDYCWKVNGEFVGTIDNKATHTEMTILAEAYDINRDPKFKTSFDKGFKFLQNLQYSSGGFSQIYPHNGKYNDYVTFNDEAMVSVLNVLQNIANNKVPFQNIVDNSQREKCTTMVEKGIDYILKSQITVKGEKAAWCAQHNPTSYKPEKARSYELASVSGNESVGIIKFLKKQTNNQEALDAAESARLWLKAHRMDNTTYSKKNPPDFFSTKSGSYCWFRFYDLTNGEGFYCDRSGNTYTDIAEFYKADSERATGYDWAGSWLQNAGLNY